MSNTFSRTTLPALLLAMLWGGSLACRHWRSSPRVFERIETLLTDLRFVIQGPTPAPESVTILAIDDETVKVTGTYPLSRSIIAQIIDAVGQMKPKAIVLDLLFLNHGQVDADHALAKALSKTPSILAAAGTFDNSTQNLIMGSSDELDSVPVAHTILLPPKVT